MACRHNAPLGLSIPMQDTKPSESQCHYPDCTSAAVKTCSKCHQSFCGLHIHRRWWSYMCDFCLWQRDAGRFHRSVVTPSEFRDHAFIDEVREKNDQEQRDELAD